jgi:hypothetical protein
MSEPVVYVEYVSRSGHYWRFTYTDSARKAMAVQVAKYAYDPDVPFTWVDAAVVVGKMRVEAKAHEEAMVGAKELAALVNEMRQAQREYFRTRSPAAMDRARQLETRVDRAVREILDQPSLF